MSTAELSQHVILTGSDQAHNLSFAAQAGKVYRMMFVQASTMKWNHISFNQSGCVMGLYSRDQAYLSSIPRLTDNIVITAANRYTLSVSAARPCRCTQLLSGMNSGQ